MEESEGKRGDKKGDKEKNISLKYLWIFAVILIIIIGWFVFDSLYVKKCADISCFNSAMAECRKSSYTSEAKDASWLYTITGRKGSFGCFLFKSRCSGCNINVRLLQAKEGTVDVRALEGLGMDCTLAFGYVGIPNSDLSRCHGALREEMQDLIIKKMHEYLLSNVGKIGEELNAV